MTSRGARAHLFRSVCCRRQGAVALDDRMQIPRDVAATEMEIISAFGVEDQRSHPVPETHHNRHARRDDFSATNLEVTSVGSQRSGVQ